LTGLTHGLAGAAIGAALSGQPAAAVLGAAAALFPDIDEPRSALGSKVPVLSVIFKLTLGHRGATHTVLAALVLSLMASGIAPYLGLKPAVCALIAFLSATSHIVLDSLTLGGTQALWPLQRRFSGPIRTGSITELPMTLVLGYVLWLLLKGA
jgi:inner membrane protein